MIKRLLRKGQAGFTLIELLVVVLVIGILAAIAVPQYFKVVEKGKFAETTQWLNALKGAQERYLARNGIYFSGTITSASFDANLGGMVHFTINGVGTASNPPAYTLTISRNAPYPAVYSNYIVTYVAPPGVMTCSDTGPCTTDLLPN